MFAVPAIKKIGTTKPSFTSLMHGRDDWNSYAQYAADIIDNGLLIRMVDSDYVKPAGFLYNYFVALCLALFDFNVGAVYVIQAILLGLSVALLFLALKGLVSNGPATYALLLFLIGFAFIDVYKYYTFRLLSENLAIFLVAFFFYVYGAISRESRWRLILMAVLLGSAILVRPNIILFGVTVALLSLFGNMDLGQGRRGKLVFVGSLFVILALLPLRNMAVGGGFHMLPIYANYLPHISNSTAHAPGAEHFGGALVYTKKLLFCLGLNNVLDPSYAFRPHWMLMWAGVILYLWHCVRRRIEIRSLEWMILVFIVLFYSVTIAIGEISNYGFRLLVPGILVPLGISIRGYELAWLSMTGKDGFKKKP